MLDRVDAALERDAHALCRLDVRGNGKAELVGAVAHRAHHGGIHLELAGRALLPGVEAELADVPAETVDPFVEACRLHLHQFLLVTVAFEFPACLAGVDRAAVVVPELDQHIVARTQFVVDDIPSSLIQEGPGTASCLGVVVHGYLLGVEVLAYYLAPADHAALRGVVDLAGGVPDDEEHRLAFLPQRAFVALLREEVGGEADVRALAQFLGEGLGVDDSPER